MARPKTGKKKINLTLSVTPEVKDMLDAVRESKDASISEVVEEYIRKEYRKLVKEGRAPEEQIPGQMSIGKEIEL